MVRLLALGMVALHLELVTKSDMGTQGVASSKGAWSTSKGDWAEFAHTFSLQDWNSVLNPCFCCHVPRWQLQDVGVLSTVSGPSSEQTDADYHTACLRCEVVRPLHDSPVPRYHDHPAWWFARERPLQAGHILVGCRRTSVAGSTWSCALLVCVEQVNRPLIDAPSSRPTSAWASSPSRWTFSTRCTWWC